MSDSGAPAATSAADDRQGPGRGVGMGEGGGVHHDAGHQRAGERAVASVERHAEAERQQGDHLARRRRVGIDPVGRRDAPSLDAW